MHTVIIFAILKEAEQSGFTAEDVQVSLNHCGESNPVVWLQENWENMIALRQVNAITGVFEPIWDAEKTPSHLEFVKCLFVLCLWLSLVQS